MYIQSKRERANRCRLKKKRNNIDMKCVPLVEAFFFRGRRGNKMLTFIASTVESTHDSFTTRQKKTGTSTNTVPCIIIVLLVRIT